MFLGVNSTVQRLPQAEVSGLNEENGALRTINVDTVNSLDEIHHKVADTVATRLQNNRRFTNLVNEAIDAGSALLQLQPTDLDMLYDGGKAKIIKQPSVYLPAFNEAIASIFNQSADARLMESKNFDRRRIRGAQLALKGYLGGQTITPRGLKASRINTMLAVEGIVTRCGTAKHQTVRATYLAERPGRQKANMQKVDYSGERFYKPRPLAIVPQHDANGTSYHLEGGLSEFQSYQRFTIQEMPENAPSGQLPCSVEVHVRGELVDAIKAGDRVCIYGIYRAKMSKENNRLSGAAQTWLDANNVVHLGGHRVKMTIQPTDRNQIGKIARRADVLEHLAHSIAPSICGGIDKKMGLLLQLVGGVPKSLENDTMRVRGDINILLLGDPSCGKSQMLRFMMQMSPLSVSTTGRGSSGVGLTAAVRQDDENKGGRVLEAGAMVMADGGLVCIDEFDKMSNDDRTAIHEVMEQQTVSISKASIQSTLNARCSVLAAANPTYGCFDDTKDIRSQMIFPDSLLSRFDLIFLVHEANTPSEDRRICRSVLSNFVAKSSDTDALMLLSEGGNFSGALNRQNWSIMFRNDESASNQIYDRKTPDGHTTYTIPFLKKYIQLARERDPVLTDEAVESISSYWVELRNKSMAGTSRARFSVPTARTLEAAIRLATAHARLGMKSVVEESDCLAAKRLLHISLLGEEYEPDTAYSPTNKINNKTKKNPKGKVTDAQKENDSGDGPRNKKRPATGSHAPASTVTETAKTLAEEMGVKRPKHGHAQVEKTQVDSIQISEDERTAMMRTVGDMKDLDIEEMTLEDFYVAVTERNESTPIEKSVYNVLLEDLYKKNKVMIHEGSVWFL